MVLGRGEVQICFEVIETGESDGVAIQIVEPVHDPKSGHDPSIEFLDQGDFGRVGLFVCAGVIDGDGLAFLVDDIFGLVVTRLFNLDEQGGIVVVGNLLGVVRGSHDDDDEDDSEQGRIGQGGKKR